MSDFFKREKGMYLINIPKLELFIPKNYFDDNVATLTLDRVITLGVLQGKAYHDKNSKGEDFLLAIPTDLFFPKNKVEMRIIDDTEYTIIVLEKNDIMMNNVNIIQSSDMVLKIITLLNSGKFPTEIGYDRILGFVLKSLDINNVNLGVPSLILESLIGTLARDKDDIGNEFRFRYSKDYKTNKSINYEYIFDSIKNIPHLTNAFNSITHENYNKSLLVGSLNKIEKKKSKKSPIENVIYY